MPVKFDNKLFIKNSQNLDTQNIQFDSTEIVNARIYKAKRNEWAEDQWNKLNAQLCKKALKANSDEQAWKMLTDSARKVMRNYTSSFFIVTRFLPLRKRKKVEAIYAAVRYPDEIVDTFPVSNEEKLQKLNIWLQHYNEALNISGIKKQLQQGIPPFLVAFTNVVKESEIPHDYYRAFLDAMRLDAEQAFYTTMDDLIDSYIYGSAIVVGYFLTYVYGSRTPEDFPQALDASKDLGIALQLTNFMRDIADDRRRTRLYIPLELLQKAEIKIEEIFATSSNEKLKSIVNFIVDIAEEYYSKTQSRIDVFSQDCQTAIQAAIDVYRQLNHKIRVNDNALFTRQSVPLIEKFKVLPKSKYWRLPLSYIFRV